MKSKSKIAIIVCLSLIPITCYYNWKYELVALHSLFGNEQHDLKVMTWNVCCSKGADNVRQRKIAELILDVDADFIQLNEFTLDSCLVIDSLLRGHYPYKEDVNAKKTAGDIMYSKIQFAESGKLDRIIPNGIYSKMSIGQDTLLVLGCHLPGNNREGQIGIDDANSLRMVKTFWGRYRHAQENRKESASYLKKTIMESSLPIIVMGDMNDFNASAPMDSLRDVGMKNAWWKVASVMEQLTMKDGSG